MGPLKKEHQPNITHITVEEDLEENEVESSSKQCGDLYTQMTFHSEMTRMAEIKVGEVLAVGRAFMAIF